MSRRRCVLDLKLVLQASSQTMCANGFLVPEPELLSAGESGTHAESALV